MPLFLMGCGPKETFYQVYFEDPRGLYPGAKVVQASSEKVIGKVSQIENKDGGGFLVKTVIMPEFKDTIHQGTMFVLYAPILSSEHAYLVVDTSPGDAGAPVLKSGSIISGMDWFSYRVKKAGDQLSPALKQLTDAFDARLKEIDRFLKSDEFDDLISSLNDQIQEIKKFTDDQKSYFEQHILPDLEKRVQEAIREFERDDKKDDADRLRKEMDDLHKALEV